MKKIFFIAAILLFNFVHAQDHYWVFLTDKAGTTFDPYAYFDSKAIERYQLNNADLYDISNYPLNASYVGQIAAIVTDNFGQSRWFNAVAVTATAEQIAAVRRLPFVREVIMLGEGMQVASVAKFEEFELNEESEARLHNQLVRMGGQVFRDKDINGKGVRIAVFDGGFPQVNTHAAFKHLRDNHQIVKTWNFPNRKENVYGWNSHGLMTLSCIAGRDGETDLGLATGAEFLLARTEVEAEPKKEEVWWQMAVEWADQNGAQIISSSLGYGKDRYYTKDMDGQSLVAKAGNMAARKGMLVCNSAGNEGDDNSWLTIITPSDADSVLCVGGINPSLTEYERTSFSSYGPSADGRQKPNVCAFAYAWTANTGRGNDDYHEVPGTSFSCPLVSGFAACALQAHPELKVMELFHEIEKSADLYPYCDYTFGYGVPQADYFTGGRKKVNPTFKFEKDGDDLKLIPLVNTGKSCRIFIKNSRPDGTIFNYQKLELPRFDDSMYIGINGGGIITAQYNGYVDSCAFNDTVDSYYMFTIVYGPILSSDWDQQDEVHYSYSLNEKNSSRWEEYLMLGDNIAVHSDELQCSLWSPSWRFGMRRTYHFSKAYGLGFAIEYGHGSYRFGDSPSNNLEVMLGVDGLVDGATKLYRHRVLTNQLSIELYQRVRLLPAGMMHKGLHWDLGAYVTVANNKYRIKYSNTTDLMAENRDLQLRNLHPLRGERLLYGVTTRLTYDIFGIYGRYNIHRLVKAAAADEVMLPTLEVGLQLAF